MPSIYLAPSSQDFNPTVVGESEEYYMNRVADALEPWLRACGIRYARNRVSMTTAQTIAASNAGDYVSCSKLYLTALMHFQKQKNWRPKKLYLMRSLPKAECPL